MSNNYLLRIENLTLKFSMYGKNLNRTELTTIRDLSLNLKRGEIAAVVGSSGSGKSLLAHSILGMLPSNAMVSGNILYKNEILDDKRRKSLLGREISFIPQSVNYLDPLMPVGKQVMGLFGTREKMQDTLRRFDLEENVADMYPYQLSGGMARRILIAGAIINSCDLIIADEPTPGLSLDMAMETMRLFRNIADQGCAVLMITHDLDLALNAADRVAVFYSGQVIEESPAADFSGLGEKLRHPYTKALWNALPQNAFQSVFGSQLYAGVEQTGCKYFDRCPSADEKCRNKLEMQTVRDGEVLCCHAS